MARVILRGVTHDNMEHAKRFGAKFDHSNGLWYAEEPIHGELSNYINDAVLKNVISPEVPRCKECGSNMVLRERKYDNASFWGCTNFKCKHTQPYHDSSFQQLSDIIIEYQSEHDDTPHIAKKDEIPLVGQEIKQLYQMAVELLGHHSAVKWFVTPKIQLNYKKPNDIILTVEGRNMIKKLLLELYD